MNRTWLKSGSILAFLGVALGAFGAHALKDKLGENRPIWDTAVHYQLVHAIALLFVAVAATSLPLKVIKLAGTLFTVGVVLFSGSLYVLALTDIKPLGAITPFGGVCFLVGWGALIYSAGKPVTSTEV